MSTPRERRLFKEFERMMALRSPYSLFTFQCADLSAPEATEFLKTKMSAEVITSALPGFLSPEEFRRQHPDAPPEKYLILYTCKGLMRTPDGNIVESYLHAMEIIFGWDYPTKAPTFVWLTPIWHPNFNPPYICTQGRPFAVGLGLDQIVLTVGEMVQYRNYNVNDPLNREAAEWARQNAHRFPVDDRDLLDRRRRVGMRVDRFSSEGEPLVQLLPPGKVEMQHPEQLIELVELDMSDIKRRSVGPSGKAGI
jgi:ubiquitin-protein ligase